MSDTLSFLEKSLNARKAEGNLRSLSKDPGAFDFVSNDYLGLARNEELYDRIQSRLARANDKTNGSGGSRLLSGNHKITEELEHDLATLFRAEACLIYNSGYSANLGLISCVAKKGDTILYDQLSHVCLKEGAWLSPAETYKFRHNDMDDLERKLQSAQGNKFVVTESVFSMDGDTCPIEELIEVTEAYQAHLIIDEAHSTGCFGQGGNGWLCEKGLEQKVFARVYTFGKGIGAHGACVAGSKLLIDYLINFSRPFIYTTALPLHSIITIREAFRFLEKNPDLAIDLQTKIDFFLDCLKNRGITLERGSLSQTAIQPIVIPGNERIKKVTKRLNQDGFDLRPILAPTVAAGTERIRLSLHVHNTKEEIESLAKRLGEELT